MSVGWNEKEYTRVSCKLHKYRTSTMNIAMFFTLILKYQWFSNDRINKANKNLSLIDAFINHVSHIYQWFSVSVVKLVLDCSGFGPIQQKSVAVVVKILPHFPVLPVCDLSALVVRDVHGVMITTRQELDRQPTVIVHNPQDVLRVLVEYALRVVHSVVFHRQKVYPINL